MVHDGHMNLRIALPQLDLNFNPSLTPPLPQPKPNRSFLVRGELLCLVPLSLFLSLSLSHLSPLKLVIYYKTSPTMLMLSLTVLTSKFKVNNSHNLTLNLKLNLNINVNPNININLNLNMDLNFNLDLNLALTKF